MKKILFASPLYFTSSVKIGGHHYARLFSENSWETYYFSNPLSPFNIVFNKNRDEVLERMKIYIRGGIRLNKVWSYVPLTFVPHHNNVPLLNQRLFLNNYYRFTFPSIKSILKKKHIDKVEIVWMDCSNQFFWTDILRHEILIYRIADNIFAFKEKSEATISSHYELMEKADLLLMTSKLLIDTPENDKYRKKILYCPNGVDLTNFNRESYSLPEEYLKLKDKPIALYIGAIDEWFDFQLLKRVSRDCKEINFVIIGPHNVIIPEDFNSNVIFLGKREYDTIPSYIYHCDIGIIPFKKNNLVKYVNPIKMYEFMSLGKPVVSTSWEELKRLNAPIYLADNHDEFIYSVKNISSGSEKFDKETLVTFAKSNTWEARYHLILEKLKAA